MRYVVIPGLEEAFERERRLREEIYLDAPHYLCGIPLRQITPRILARLFFVRTPFFGNGEVTPAAIGQFLWACHRDYERPARRWPWQRANRKRDAFLRSLRGMDFAALERGIDAFLDETFLDAPYGDAKNSVPYVCGIAWMEYRMACDPFRWDSERTLDTPLRRIYQLIRCYAREHGEVLYNRLSDKAKDDYLNQRMALRSRIRENVERSRAARAASRYGKN